MAAGVPASVTAGAGRVPIAGEDGKLDADWLPAGSGGASAAEDVTFTPVGTIAATDAQAAIAEVATDAAAALAAHNHAGVYSPVGHDHSGVYAPAAHTHAAADVTGLAAVATSGSASDLGAGTLPLGRLSGITDSQVAAANKDGAAGTASMRTLGTGAQQAAAGDHAHAGVYSPAAHDHDAAYAPLSHNHSAADLTSGTVPDARMPALTGDVTTSAGAVATAINKTAITGKTLVSAAVGDHVLIADESDSDNLKRVTVQTIVDLAAGGGGTAAGTTFAPAGDIAATDVQAAVEELDAEKAKLCVVDVFDSSGTWTKRPGAKAVSVVGWGGGGGAGSGRYGTGTSQRGGGGGGQGGASNGEIVYNAADLGETETVTIGAGGVGHTHPGTFDTDGGFGTAGGASTFGAWYRAAGGAAGFGGTASAGGAAGTATQTNTLAAGSNGTAGSANGNNGSTANVSMRGAGGGGGGGGINTGNSGGFGGQGSGGMALRHGTTTFGGGAGGAAVASGTAGATWCGGGGGGGFGQNGGNGGPAGGGGGGQGGNQNGAASGKGGDGGNGRIVVTTFF